jgi:maleamate amidohydrolase
VWTRGRKFRAVRLRALRADRGLPQTADILAEYGCAFYCEFMNDDPPFLLHPPGGPFIAGVSAASAGAPAAEGAALDEDYRAAGFGGRLEPGRRTALVIVDLVMAYLDPASPLYARGEAALACNERLLAAARAAGVMIVFTRVVYQPGGADGGVFFRKVPALAAFVGDGPLGHFPSSAQPGPGEIVVTKQYPSAFFGTHLASTLRAAGVDTVMLTGYSTSGCVRASALDAVQNGFIPLVVRQACADRDSRPHEANLFDMQAKMAEVIDEADALRILGESA